ERVRYTPLLSAPALAPDYARKLRDYAAAMSKVYHSVRTVSGADVVVDTSKYPSSAYLLRHVPDVELKLVHLVRSVYGVCYSWSKTVARPDRDGKPMPQYPPARTAVEWSAFNFLLDALRLRGVPTRLVHYEDFVAAPRAELAGIVRFLGGEVSDADLAFVGESSVELPRDHSVAGNPMRFRSGPEQLRLDEAWRTALDPRTRRLISLVSAPAIVRYGYARDLRTGNAPPGRSARAVPALPAPLARPVPPVPPVPPDPPDPPDPPAFPVPPVPPVPPAGARCRCRGRDGRGGGWRRTRRAGAGRGTATRGPPTAAPPRWSRSAPGPGGRRRRSGRPRPPAPPPPCRSPPRSRWPGPPDAARSRSSAARAAPGWRPGSRPPSRSPRPGSRGAAAAGGPARAGRPAPAPPWPGSRCSCRPSSARCRPGRWPWRSAWPRRARPRRRSRWRTCARRCRAAPPGTRRRAGRAARW